MGTVATSAGPTASALMYAASRLGRSIHRPVEAYQLPFDYRGLGIDRKLVDAVHAADAHLHVWTVNEPEDMDRLIELDVDGIVTDRPDLLNEVMGVGAG
jgi:glycerophosphoryl diester phosphodiesterase